MTSNTAKPAATPARRLIIVGATGAAAIATGAAYFAMVGFGRDVVGMTAVSAYLFAGVLEICLVTVALMAREAAQQQRPNGLLLGLTWGFSGASATFAAAHEIALDHSAVAAGFRFIVPFLAALMWHLVLVGDRHLASGRSWSQLRASGRMHAALEAVEDYHDAWKLHHDAEHGGTAATRKKLVKAREEMKRAGRVARRTVDPEQMGDELSKFVDAFREFAGGVETAWTLQAGTRNIETGTAGDIQVEQLAPTPDVDQVAADLQSAVRGPAELPARVSPAVPVQDAAEAVTEPSEPVSTPARPHLVKVPAMPAEEKVSGSASTAPEPSPPAKRDQADTTATAELQLEAAALRADGHKVKEIARRLSAKYGRNVSERSVYRWTGTKAQAS
ncbi:hypothetical protein [Nocardioides sp.]|uniref:hypothetical protein n=1 Tax=Nocardioides sp. TaxID=35761 RepID=UPI0019C08281|nr:hypothetical protein [Nocardioides sp.]MBC7279212.1 hypothetical protein [Nocardioides sp.]